MKIRLIAACALLSMLFAVGCSQNRANTPDVTAQVKDQLKASNLGDVKVDQNREKGVLTLSGDVASEDDKARAEEIAKQNAPGLVIANELGVRPAGAEGNAGKIDKNLDKGIEDNFRAALTAGNLDNQHIRFDSKNGVLTLKGDVDTAAQRQAAEEAASKVPNVGQVVNELTVKHQKASAARHK